MLNQKFVEEIASKLSQLAAQSPIGDLEKNVRAIVQSGLAKLDLVTREEFDVQADVLARTRAKLEALEAKVAAMENRKPESETPDSVSNA